MDGSSERIEFLFHEPSFLLAPRKWVYILDRSILKMLHRKLGVVQIFNDVDLTAVRAA